MRWIPRILHPSSPIDNANIQSTTFRPQRPGGHRNLKLPPPLQIVPRNTRRFFKMRQFSLVLATVLAVFIMLSVYFMSHTSSLHESMVPDARTSAEEASQLAQQAAQVNLDLMETGINHVNTNPNPVTPSLTQGHVIMPHLGNETIKYGRSMQKRYWCR